ncbi:hypothetical protein [Dolichospermum circinale]|uniref:hypothetical protein n=1 Tax=Dolichospermum circinale TaxID=109265 RepID=UPI003A8CF038
MLAKNVNLNHLSISNHKSEKHKHPLTPNINVAEIPPILPKTSKIDNNQITLNQYGINKLPNTTETKDSNLERIRNLADEGYLTEAISQCQKYLQVDITSVEAYLLCGQIHQAQGLESQAEECFQKAVYLDPKNPEALLHLTLLKEQKGDMIKAKILRQRLQRLQLLRENKCE